MANDKCKCPVLDEHDAKYIVRAVNSHDALTAAGKRLADVAEACARGDDEAVPESLRNLTQQDVADAINAMRVALTAAGVTGVSAPLMLAGWQTQWRRAGVTSDER